MSNRKVAFTLLALLLVQVAVPFIPADAAVPVDIVKVESPKNLKKKNIFLATEEKLGKRIYEKEGGSGVFCQQKQS